VGGDDELLLVLLLHDRRRDARRLLGVVCVWRGGSSGVGNRTEKERESE
jgi:hypothetical protein